MVYQKPEVRAANWTEKDYLERFAELRSEVLPDLYSHRADTDDWASRNRAVITEMDEMDVELRAWRNANSSPEPRRIPAGSDMQTRAGQTYGERAVAHDNMKDWLSRHDGTSPKVTVAYRAAGDPVNLGAVGGLLPVAQPYLAVPYRVPLTIRNLLTVIPTQFEVIPFRSITSPETTNATVVAEGGTKPLSTLNSTPHTATLEVIAVGERVSNRIISDATVAAIINQQATYEVQLAEEHELLNGSGTSPHLKGFYSYSGSGLQTQAYTNTDVAATLGLAMSLVAQRGGTVDGVVMNATDAWGMWTHRASTNTPYDAGNPFGSAPTTVWGQTVVTTPSMTAGKALVGAFRQGARLWDREELSVQVFNQHSTWALSNEVLVLVEERIALTVERPDFFVDATIASA